MKKSQNSSFKRTPKISKKEAERDILELAVELITESGGMVLKDNFGKVKGVQIER